MKTTKIRQAARGQDCTLRVPGVCNFDPETVVLAHAPCADKGMGYKSPDWWAAFACSACHAWIDRRVTTPYPPISTVPDIWLQGIYETQKKLRDKGLL